MSMSTIDHSSPSEVVADFRQVRMPEADKVKLDKIEFLMQQLVTAINNIEPNITVTPATTDVKLEPKFTVPQVKPQVAVKVIEKGVKWWHLLLAALLPTTAIIFQTIISSGILASWLME